MSYNFVPGGRSMMEFLDYSCPGKNSHFHYGPRQAGAEFVPIILLHDTCACSTIPAPTILAPAILAPAIPAPTILAPAILAPTILAPALLFLPLLFLPLLFLPLLFMPLLFLALLMFPLKGKLPLKCTIALIMVL